MLRIVLAAVLGGIVVFVWGAVSWTVLGWHQTNGGKLPNENEVVEVLQKGLAGSDEPGVYWFPGMPDMTGMDDEKKDAANEAWKERHRQGPVGVLVVHPRGAEPMPPSMFAKGIGIDVLAALIAAILLAGTARCGYFGRVIFVAGLGLFIAVTGDLTAWNFMYFPTDWTLVNVADDVVTWLLAGLVIAACVKGKGGSEGVGE